MNDRTEGTVVLDGLIEGQLPAGPEGEAGLRQWVRLAGSANLPFSLEIDGGSFSLLADKTPIPLERIGLPAARRIAERLDELLALFAPDQRRTIFSTLRSSEYRRDLEIQTIYAVGPEGRVQTRERTVEVATTPPPRKLARRDKLRLAGIGVVIAMLAFLVSAIFVDYRALLGGLLERVLPINPDELKIETGPFADYFIVEKRSVNRGDRTLVLTLKRRAGFPVTDADLDRLAAESGSSLPKRLTVEALARGYVRCECFDKDGRFLGFGHHRISALRRKETAEIAVPLPQQRRLARVAITY